MRKLLLFAVLLTPWLSVFGLDQEVFWIDSAINAGGEITLDRYWKYHKGDDPEWGAIMADDSDWDNLSPYLNIDSIAEGTFDGIGWFRIYVGVDSSLTNQTIALRIRHYGASEIYWDGELLDSWGEVSTTEEGEVRYNPQGVPFLVHLNESQFHIIAVRYSNHHAGKNYSRYFESFAGFELDAVNADVAVIDSAMSTKQNLFIAGVVCGILFGLSFLHLILFLYYRKQRSNLFYSLFTVVLAFVLGGLFVDDELRWPGLMLMLEFVNTLLLPFLFVSLLALVYALFYERMLKFMWVILGLAVVADILSFFGSTTMVGNILFIIIAIAVVIELVRASIVAIYRKRDGAWIIGGAVMFFMLAIASLITITLLAASGLMSNQINFSFEGGISGLIALILIVYVVFCIPISMSIYLARDFLKKNKDLETQVVEIQRLSEETVQKEQEKQAILEGQKEKLEKQVTERTEEIRKQKETIEEKNKDITDSINYATRIQNSIMPPEDYIKKLLPEHFLFYRPKDIVSGDFYWAGERDGWVIFAAVDCTGHGVPGALMSVVGLNLIHEAVDERGMKRPADIVKHLDWGVNQTLRQDDEGSAKDGMDLAVCSINFETGELQYAGAYNPLYYISKGELHQIKANKFPIGVNNDGVVDEYDNHEVQLDKGDCVYLFSDGYADQFGGPKGKKFKYSQLRDLFMGICKKPMHEQGLELGNTMDQWQGELEQIDDIVVFGVRY